MLSGNELYVIVKFTSGEQCMAVLEQEDLVYVQLLYPMIIKTTIDFAVGKEHITSTPLCQFSDEKTFLIDKRNILFIKKMHSVFIPHYQRIVKEHNETAIVTNSEGHVQQQKAEDLNWGEPDADELTSEEIKKRIQMLNSLIEEEEKKEKMNLVEGNDTVH